MANWADILGAIIGVAGGFGKSLDEERRLRSQEGLALVQALAGQGGFQPVPEAEQMGRSGFERFLGLPRTGEASLGGQMLRFQPYPTMDLPGIGKIPVSPTNAPSFLKVYQDQAAAKALGALRSRLSSVTLPAEGSQVQPGSPTLPPGLTTAPPSGTAPPFTLNLEGVSEADQQALLASIQGYLSGSVDRKAMIQHASRVLGTPDGSALVSQIDDATKAGQLQRGAPAPGAQPRAAQRSDPLRMIDQRIAAIDDEMTQVEDLHLQYPTFAPLNTRIDNLRQNRSSLIQQRNHFESLEQTRSSNPAERYAGEIYGVPYARLDQGEKADVNKRVQDEALKLSREQGVAAVQERPLEMSERERFSALARSQDVIEMIATQFSPAERAKYVGMGGLRLLENQALQIIQDATTGKADPRFAQFLALVQEAKREAFASGGKQLTPFEASVVFGFVPTGRELSAEQFEQKLSLAQRRVKSLFDTEMELAIRPRKEAPEIIRRREREFSKPSTNTDILKKALER